jgi:hypothetical protein
MHKRQFQRERRIREEQTRTIHVIKRKPVWINSQRRDKYTCRPVFCLVSTASPDLEVISFYLN